jgi:hypothetical protein
METLSTRNRSYNNLFILLALFSITSPATAMDERQNRAISMKIGLSAADINYEEKPVGAQTHTEEGTVPGVYISFKEQLERLYGELVINYNKGKSDYSGQAQDTLGNYLGLIDTDTDTELLDTYYRVGGYINRDLEMYGGFGYRYWRRDINAASLSNGSPVEGLLQRFTWFYGLVGAKYHFINRPDLGLAVNVQARRMINPKVSAKNTTVSTSIDLDETWGYQVSLPVTIKVSSTYALTIEPFATQWQLDQTSDGLGNVLPDNESNTYGIHFILSW